MNYSDLKLKRTDDYTTISINNQDIKVQKYLPIKDKIDLIQIALQNSLEDGIYNDMKLDVFFHLYVIYMYTDLIFTKEEKADPFKLYDELESNYVVVNVLGAMGEHEYNILIDYLKTTKAAYEKYNSSMTSFIKTMIQDLPKNAEAAAEIVKNFNPDEYPEVVRFANAANGNRTIPMVKDEKD